ncbi:signal peptidase I [Rhodococcus sp. BP-332]|uniref:signal peptidase I n=1 Tax=Rhodococcus sp. BP-332 TaxID=2739447 RepID=UPI001C9AB79F|nr:signal peptidase I [Rhodococcus sp. BP-332]MBY6676669.1 signal peptidase I [Rhodococcus sp. BP-332]
MSRHRSARDLGLRWWVGRILSYTALFGALAILAATVVVPRIAGAVPYTILTSSMEPTYPPGTLIVVREVRPTDLGIGVPVTYQLESGRPEVVTHRIVSVLESADGGTRYITRGDNNNADDAPIEFGQIRGAVWYSVPFLGHVNTWINGEQRRISVLVISGFLFLYAVVMFGGAFRGRRAEKESSS